MNLIIVMPMSAAASSVWVTSALSSSTGPVPIAESNMTLCTCVSTIQMCPLFPATANLITKIHEGSLLVCHVRMPMNVKPYLQSSA